MTEKTLTPESVQKALGTVQDPALGKDLVSAGLIGELKIDGDVLGLTVSLISPGHPHQAEIERDARAALKDVPGLSKVDLSFKLAVPGDGRQRGRGPEPIRTEIAVASGKGGVGKSTVAVNLAVALAQNGAKVGLMDADVYGPNIPRMMGVDRLPPQSTEAGVLEPAEAYGVRMISIGFLVSPEQPMIWRGPMLHGAVRQFVQDVHWGELDYLVVDLPPGTGDVQLSLAQTSPLTGGLIVTLPQQVSLEDARRGLEMFRQLEVPILGVVENMSHLELPDGQQMDVFGAGGGERMAGEAGVPFLGSLPLDPAVRVGGDSGEPIVISHPDSPVAQALSRIAADVALRTSLQALEQQSKAVPIKIVD